MKLSKNFSLTEMQKSQTAERRGIPNVANDLQIESMVLLAKNILQPIRDEFGPFMVSSGFRCPELCIAVGSNIHSQHAKGEAADFEVPNIDNLELARWIRDNLDFDQLILECYTGGNSGWIHCSYKPEGNRKQMLTYDRVNGYRDGLLSE